MSLHSSEAPEAVPLRQRWLALLESEPRTRARDAAERLGVSEAELVASGLGAEAVRLDLRLEALLPRLESLGHVMALTRNASAVHEKKGVYRDFKLHGARALFVGEDIDMRLFLSRWRFGFAVREGGPTGGRRSLQFFDETGTAIHKVYPQEDGDAAAFERLLAEFTSDDQSMALELTQCPPAQAPRPDEAVNVEGMREAWRALQDTHDFFWMLQRFEVARVQALRLAGPELATAVAPSALTWVLERAAATGQSIMVFVGNRGAIQIHTGPVKTVRPMGPWINVLDPGFSLHVRADQVASAWVVRKPTQDGVVTSVELFDAAGENIALLFGKRGAGNPESPEWRALTEELARTLPAQEVVS